VEKPDLSPTITRIYLARSACMPKGLYIFYVKFETTMSISVSLLVRLSPRLVNVYRLVVQCLSLLFSFFDLGCMLKLGQVTNFTIVGGTAKHCVDQYMVLFCYCSLGCYTAMPGGLHARLCHAFLSIYLFTEYLQSSKISFLLYIYELIS